MWRPTSHLGLLWGISALFKGPRETRVKPHSPNTLILSLLGSNIIELVKGSSWSPIMSNLVLKPALDSLSVDPKCQNHQLAAYGLKVCCKWSPPYVIFSPLKRRTMNSYLSTRTLKPLQIAPASPAHHGSLSHRKSSVLVLYMRQTFE